MLKDTENKFRKRKEDEVQSQLLKSRKYKARTILNSKLREKREVRYKQKIEFDKVYLVQYNSLCVLKN
jgi:ectoine hydroxylase-related dioxygenase (phytanoyl-CoA dioxygenase family)